MKCCRLLELLDMVESLKVLESLELFVGEVEGHGERFFCRSEEKKGIRRKETGRRGLSRIMSQSKVELRHPVPDSLRWSREELSQIVNVVGLEWSNLLRFEKLL